MNLRFTPTVLALVFAIKSAGARRTGEELLVSELADVHSDDSERNNEKSTAHRRAELISTSIFEQGPADGLRFYYPDVGILQGRKSHSRSGFYMNGRGQRSHAVSHSGTDKRLRFLEVEEAPICGTNGTCLPSACECMANLTPLSDRCAPVFNSLCNGYTDVDGKNWTSEGCMSPAYPAGLREYVKHYSCPVVKCLVEGGTYEDCFCQMYHSLCLTYGDERPYQNDERALDFCAADTCCQSKTDEAGRLSCMFGAFSRREYREEHPRCGANGTCSPSVCNCVANKIFLFDCAVPQNDICNGVPDANGKQWTFEGCYRDYPGYPEFQRYQRTGSCEVAKCVVDGGTYGSCYCRMYHSLCEEFGDARTYNYYAEAPGHCMIDKCCKTKVDEAGMRSCLGLITSSFTIEYPNITLEETTADQSADSLSSAEETSSADDSATSGAKRLMSVANVQAMFSFAAAVATVWFISRCGVT